MSRNYAVVDQVNNTVQFTIVDACSSISFVSKKAGQYVNLLKSEISVDLVRKGKTDINLYKDSYENINMIVNSIFNKNLYRLIPLSFKNDFGQDLNLSDNVSVKITIKFYKGHDTDESVDSFEYEMNKLGKSKGDKINTLPFTFKKVEVDTIKEIDTEYFKHLVIIGRDNLISLASDTPKDGDVYLTKECLNVEFLDYIHLETGLNQTVEVKSNGVTNVYLVQY